MKQYLKNWNFMRILQLTLSIFIIVQGFQINDRILILLGALFSLMPILNKGCCNANKCQATSSTTESTKNEIQFEEIR